MCQVNFNHSLILFSRWHSTHGTAGCTPSTWSSMSSLRSISEKFTAYFLSISFLGSVLCQEKFAFLEREHPLRLNWEEFNKHDPSLKKYCRLNMILPFLYQTGITWQQNLATYFNIKKRHFFVSLLSSDPGPIVVYQISATNSLTYELGTLLIPNQALVHMMENMQNVQNLENILVVQSFNNYSGCMGGYPVKEVRHLRELVENFRQFFFYL